jgi:hypothetical protein
VIPAPIGEPVDLEALVLHASRLSADLETAWARALADVDETIPQTVLKAQWSSVATAMVEGSRALTERLQAAGIELRLPELPPFAGEVAGLQAQPSPERALRQAQMGQLVAFEELARAVAVLLGSVEAECGVFSPAGAFALARDRAMLVARLSRGVSRAEVELLGDARRPTAATPPALARLTLARAAWSRGDPEASLVHLHLTARMLIADLVGVSPADLPEELGRLLGARGRLEPVSSMLTLANTLIQAIAAGDEPDLAVVTVLVPNLLTVLRQIATTPPVAALRDALASAGLEMDP